MPSTGPERILVCVGPAPSSARLIRAAARMAAEMSCPWIAAYVDSVASETLTKADRERLEDHLRSAESLGATAARLTGQRVATTLVAYARQRNVTRIVIGKPTHSRLRDRIRGSLLNEVVRGSGTIDVHVVSGDEAAATFEAADPSPARRAPLWQYASSALIMVATLGVAVLLRSATRLPDLEMLFLLPVMLCAVWFGRGPALAAAGFGVACYDFFFVPPFHTFAVNDHTYFLTFAMMFGVGLVVSELTARLRRHERDAILREERTAVLYSLTRELASATQGGPIANVATRQAAELFRASVVMLSRQNDGEFVALSAAPAEPDVSDTHLALAEWVVQHDALSGLGCEALPESGMIGAPLRVGPTRLGVLLLTPHDGKPFSSEQRAFLDAFCKQVAAALDRARLAEEARRTALRVKAEELRSSLLSAVSHDLRTPLATITGAATTLRDGSALDDETRMDLVDAIVEQAERLERLVTNLLDMTRLESGALTPKKDWVPLEEIIGSALTRLERGLGQRKITIDIGEHVPLLQVDPVLLEQLFVNLLENANKYTPPTASIEIRAKPHGNQVSIDVLDNGPGLPPEAEARVFEKFFRGPHSGRSGAGLGLAICKGVVEAHGGRISAENREGGGAAFHIVLPNGAEPPPILPSPGVPA